jgi:hypothetical protein
MNKTPHDKKMELLAEAGKLRELEKYLVDNGVPSRDAYLYTWTEERQFLYEMLSDDDCDAEKLFSMLAKKNYDGHYTIFRFTTGYKAGFGTPDLRAGWSNDILYKTYPTFPTIKEAMLWAIVNDKAFKE